MSFETKQHREIIRARILFNALIKTVLFCWNHGCPIANPHMDIRFLARNNHLIINLLEDYFKKVPVSTSNQQTSIHDLPLARDCANSLHFFFDIQRLHSAVAGSERKCARRIVGNHPNETVENLVHFFEQQVTSRQANSHS